MSDKEKSFEELAEEGLQWVQGDIDPHLQAIHKKIDARIKNPPTAHRKAAIILLMVLLVSVLLYFWAFHSKNETKKSGEGYFAAYYEKFPNVIQGTTRSIEKTYDNKDSLAEAVGFYEKNNIPQALLHFPKHGTPEVREKSDLYHGLSLLEMNKATEALGLLTPLTKSRTSGISQAAEWYCALALLRSNEFGKARIFLKDIANDTNHYQSANARIILDSLEK